MELRKRITHAQRGFTLSEILVTTAIFAIIMIAALTVYDRSNRVFKSSAEAADMQQSTRIGFDKLVADLRMAGFDYNRGGTPEGNGQYPQPDEQIEYAGPTAVVFRANFDYNTNASNGNGLATGYTTTNSSGTQIFPYVTTDNSEIVAYVLRSSAPGAANADSISFWVDSSVPRRAYPNVAGLTSGGQAESQITINGIDTSNANPPYTLYRVTVDDVLNSRLGTPVAENIRSVNFKYFSDGAGTVPLTNPDGTVITSGRNADGSTFTAAPATCTATTLTDCSGAIGGAGRYDPSNIGGTTNFDDRSSRALIQSVRVDLVGMNATPERDFQNPTETNASFKSYREYALSSLVVPRNLGKTGFPEPSYNPPGPPTITGACLGHCGAPIIYWAAPTAGGPVVSYRVEWDTNPNGTFPNGFPIGDPTARSAIVPDDGTVTDFSQTVYYHVVAINDNGASQPSAYYQAIPQNSTKPSAPTGGAATTNQNNQITLSWVAPSTNASGSTTCSGTGGTAQTTPAIPYPQEVVKFRVVRGTDPNFDPNDPSEAVQVLGYTSPSQPSQAAGGATVTWIDNPANSASAPAACVTYYYRVRALDHCYQHDNWNTTNDARTAMSDWSSAFSGQATSSSTPAKIPGTPIINRSSTSCTGSNPTSTCNITIQWQKVAQDTSGNAIAVDTYEIKRERRPLSTGGTFSLDTTFNGTGTKDVSGFTQMVTPTWQDTNVAFGDPTTGQWEYQYTIAAKVCTTYGVFSDPVLFPGCTLNAVVSDMGSASSGNGTSPSSPWVMGYSDVIAAAGGSGVSIQSVVFSIYAYPAATLVGTQTVTTATTTLSGNPAYVLNWTDLTDGQIYQVWINLTDVSGCSETHIAYVQQETQAACQFANQAPPTASSPASSSTYSISGHPSSQENANYNFIIPNTTSTAINVTQTTPSAFTGVVNITWRDPCLANPSVSGCNGNTFPDLTLKSVEWDVPATGCASVLTKTVGSLGPIGTTASLTTTFALPSQSICNVAGSGRATLKIVFQYDGRGKPTLPANPAALLDICISYKNPNDPTRTQFCNLVGQSATTNNPRSCD